jgi:hypothetical protein
MLQLRNDWAAASFCALSKRSIRTGGREAAWNRRAVVYDCATAPAANCPGAVFRSKLHE